MRKNSMKTLAHFLGAMANQRAVSIRYVKENGEISRRTIEVYGIEVSKAGNVLVKAWDRRDEEPTTFRLDRITHYTLHRAASAIARYTQPVTAVDESEDTWTDPADDEVYTIAVRAWELAA